MLGLLREVIWHIIVFKGGNLAEGYLKMRGRAASQQQRCSTPSGKHLAGLPPPSQELLRALLSVGNPHHLGRGDSEHLEETETIAQACKGAAHSRHHHPGLRLWEANPGKERAAGGTGPYGILGP